MAIFPLSSGFSRSSYPSTTVSPIRLVFTMITLGMSVKRVRLPPGFLNSSRTMSSFLLT